MTNGSQRKQVGKDRAAAPRKHHTTRDVGRIPFSAAQDGFLSESVLMTLQRTAGNRAVSELVQRSPGAPASDVDVLRPDSPDVHIQLPGSPATATRGLEPFVGDPVKGYERARSRYTKEDRQHLIDAVNEHQKKNDNHVMGFSGDFSEAITTLWSTHLTEQMSRAAAEKALMTWGKFTELLLEEAVITALGMGIGSLAELTVAELFEHHIKGLITSKAIEVFGEAAIKATNESAKNKLEQDEIEKTRQELDEKTKKVAHIEKELHDSLIGALDIPWASYGGWLMTASDAELGRFRLPKIFPSVDTDKIKTAAGAAIVTVLHDSHTEDAPARIGADPTEEDLTSYFDDFQIISHLAFGGETASELTEESTELYARNSNPLLGQLVGKPIGQMGHIPLFVAIGTNSPQVLDWVAARRIIEGVGREAFRQYGTSMAWDFTEVADEFVSRYPARERELRITRAPKAGSQETEGVASDVEVRGGGLGEQFELLRRARGASAERDLIEEIMGTADVKAVLQPHYRREEDPYGHDFPLRQVIPVVQNILTFWMHAGAQQLIDKYVAGLKPKAPEDRWAKAYFEKGTRKQILKR